MACGIHVSFTERRWCDKFRFGNDPNFLVELHILDFNIFYVLIQTKKKPHIWNEQVGIHVADLIDKSFVWIWWFPC